MEIWDATNTLQMRLKATLKTSVVTIRQDLFPLANGLDICVNIQRTSHLHGIVNMIPLGLIP